MSHILHSDVEAGSEASDLAPVTLDVARFDAAGHPEGAMQRYVLPYRKRMSIFTALREIYEHQDCTLAFRNQQCGRGICGTCNARVDLERLGFTEKFVKSCSVLIQPGDHIVVRPPSRKSLIRDLVTEG